MTIPFQRHEQAGQAITRALRAAERAKCGDAVLEALLRAKLELIQERRRRFEEPVEKAA